QRGGDRRHAHGVAADPADRDPPGPWRAAPVLAEHAVQRVAGPAALARGLGPGDPLGVGVLALRPAVTVRRLPRVPPARRRGRLRWSRSWSSTTTTRCAGCSNAR